jgi:hypothetical protein
MKSRKIGLRTLTRRVSFFVLLAAFLSSSPGDMQIRIQENYIAVGEDNSMFRCAMCFFGLTRSYKSLVLPSIVENILKPNLKYNCDIFVHFYDQESEPRGRFNLGGDVNFDEIYLLRHVFNNLSNFDSSMIAFSNDTMETFMAQRSEQLTRYLGAKDFSGRPLYFPWKDKSWKKSTLVNLVKQWHSISRVFKLIEDGVLGLGRDYTRVAMLRNDVMFLTPIDIWEVGEKELATNETVIDTFNQFFTLAPFALYPVNDRMVYGPFEAVQIWAKRRFVLIENWARNMSDTGYAMHAERFMNGCLIPAMEKLGYRRWTNPKICFVRTRPRSKVLYHDCSMPGHAIGFEKPSSVVKSVESIIGKPCNVTNGNAWNRDDRQLQCI